MNACVKASFIFLNTPSLPDNDQWTHLFCIHHHITADIWPLICPPQPFPPVQHNISTIKTPLWEGVKWKWWKCLFLILCRPSQSILKPLYRTVKRAIKRGAERREDSTSLCLFVSRKQGLRNELQCVIKITTVHAVEKKQTGRAPHHKWVAM